MSRSDIGPKPWRYTWSFTLDSSADYTPENGGAPAQDWTSGAGQGSFRPYAVMTLSWVGVVGPGPTLDVDLRHGTFQPDNITPPDSSSLAEFPTYGALTHNITSASGSFTAVANSAANGVAPLMRFVAPFISSSDATAGTVTVTVEVYGAGA